MTVKDIYNYIDYFAPFDSQAEWDNAGLLAGDADRDVTAVIVSLDVTKSEIELAKREKAELIISHHPLIFHPVKTCLKNSVLFDVVHGGLSVISAHTNLDKAVDGVNDTLCETIGLGFEKIDAPIADGFLNICTDERCLSPDSFAEYLGERLSAGIRFSRGGEKVSKIAVCSGAGSEFASEAASLGCDAFLTGDASYHDFLNCSEMGISLFSAGHFETENPIIYKLAERLGEHFPSVRFIVSDRKPPVETVN